MADSIPNPSTQGSDAQAITRPDPALLKYYFVVSLLTLFGFPIVFLISFIRYETLRYRFDEDGVWMAWGILFRKEITLTYRRIQDIHVTRNILHRWLGLSRVDIQTAAGGTGPQMSIEGIREAEGLRDFLYARMRGAKGQVQPAYPPQDDALNLLREIRGSVERLNQRLGSQQP